MVLGLCVVHGAWCMVLVLVHGVEFDVDGKLQSTHGHSTYYLRACALLRVHEELNLSK